MEPGDQGGGDDAELRARLTGELLYVVSSIRLVADGLRRIEAAPDSAPHQHQLRAGLAALDEARAAAERVQAALAAVRMGAPALAPTGSIGPTDPLSEAPRSTRETAVPASAPIPASAPRPRNGHILVVDDEPLVGRLVERALVRDHHVTVVTAGRAALERLTAGERFDLILCDLMMPEMTGMDLFDRVTELAPDQAERMVFLTGGAFTRRARDFLRERPFLEKPFDLSALEAVVRERLR